MNSVQNDRSRKRRPTEGKFVRSLQFEGEVRDCPRLILLYNRGRPRGTSELTIFEEDAYVE